jgi:hypothetical protein
VKRVHQGGRQGGPYEFDWLREQRKYNGTEALKEQIGRDVEQTIARVDQDVSRAIGAA